MYPIYPSVDSLVPVKSCRLHNASVNFSDHLAVSLSDRFIRPLFSEQMIYASYQLEPNYLASQSKVTLNRRIVPINPAASRISDDEYIRVLQSRLPYFSQSKNKIFSLDIERILDAPNFVNDYYRHLLTINNSGLTVIALDDCIYGATCTYNVMKILVPAPSDSTISCLMPLESRHHVSNKLLYSNDVGMMTVLDLTTKQAMWSRVVDCSQNVHQTILSAVDDHCFYVATYNGSIIKYDVRISTMVNQYQADADRACSLAFNHGNALVSGNNNNKIFMYDIRRLSSGPVFSYNEHQAGVRAIDFSPCGEFVVSGGGSACKTLAVWQSSTGETCTKLKTDMQITSVKWLPDQKNSIYTSNGFSANYGITGWRYQRLCESAKLIKCSESLHLKDTGTRLYDIAYDVKNSRFSSVASSEALYFFKMPEKNKRKFSTRDDLRISDMHRMNLNPIR